MKGLQNMSEETPTVKVDAPVSEPEAEAAVEIVEEHSEQVETITDAAVEIERLRQEGETARCAIEAEARIEEAEAYSEVRVLEAENVAEQIGEGDKWRLNIEASLTSLTASLAELAERLTPPPSMPVEQPDPTSSLERSEGDPSAVETALEPPEPPKRAPKLRWI